MGRLSLLTLSQQWTSGLWAASWLSCCKERPSFLGMTVSLGSRVKRGPLLQCGSGAWASLEVCPLPYGMGLPVLSHSSTLCQGLGLEWLATRCFLS